MTAVSTTPVPSARPRPLARVRGLLPELVVAVFGTALAFGASRLVPTLGALTVAVVLGVLVGRFLPAPTRSGLEWATRAFLRLGVVLLGLQLGLGAVLGLGPGVVVAVVATVLLSFGGTLVLGRLVGVPPGLRLMVATGFSICGASAIAAMDSVRETEKQDVATAVTLVTLYGSAAIAPVPMVGNALGLDADGLGAWAGLSVHEVAQVVAAASPAGAAAVGIAVIVKLTRVVLLAPIIACVGVAERRRGTVTDRRPPLVPLFVVGFLAMIAARSSGIVPAAVLSAAQVLTTLLFTAALFGLGSAVRLGALLRTGRRGLVLGALSTLLVGLLGLGTLAAAGAI